MNHAAIDEYRDNNLMDIDNQPILDVNNDRVIVYKNNSDQLGDSDQRDNDNHNSDDDFAQDENGNKIPPPHLDHGGKGKNESEEDNEESVNVSADNSDSDFDTDDCNVLGKINYSTTLSPRNKSKKRTHRKKISKTKAGKN